MTSVAEVVVEKVKEAEFEEKEEVKICPYPNRH